MQRQTIAGWVLIPSCYAFIMLASPARSDQAERNSPARVLSIHSCDNLAGYPGYIGTVGPGVPWEKLDPTKAVPVCQDALKAFPSEVRFRFQLGRALLKAKQYEKAIPYLKQSAEKKYSPAYLGLGSIEENGLGVPINLSAALGWYRKAKNDGIPAASYALGTMYYRGAGVERNYDEAAILISRAATAGLQFAQRYLGLLYRKGRGVEQDYEAAIKWVRLSAEAGNSVAQVDLGLHYFNGWGVEKNIKTSVKWFLAAARVGNITAQVNLSEIFQGELGHPAHPKKAFKWAQKAAKQGNKFAQGNLGHLYDQGIGVSKDLTKAEHWYLMAARQGDAFAQRKLGLLYSSDSHSLRDLTKAIEWYSKAAEQGDTDAISLLASVYDLGKGVAKNPAKAARLYEQAAILGDVYSQTKIGNRYSTGDGVDQNFNKALKWLKLAAGKKHIPAQRELGHIYHYGRGVEKNIQEAIRWYRLAEEGGDTESISRLAGIYRLGNGIEEDAEHAFQLYLKAAKKGHTYSKSVLGSMYYIGNGTEKNLELAKKWFLSAANEGNTYSEYFLGFIFLNGRKTETNFKEAFKWFKRAGQKKHISSLISISSMYEKGLGRSQNFQKADLYLLEARKILVSAKSLDLPQLAEVNKARVSLYIAMGRYFIAEDVAKEVLAEFEKVHGHDSFKVSEILNDLGRIYYSQGRYEEAKQVFPRIFKILSKDIPRYRFARGYALRSIANLHEKQGNLAGAEESYKEAVEILSPVKQLNLDSWSGLLTEYGNVLARRSKFELAEQTLKEAHNIMVSQHGDDHPYNAYALLALANLSRRAGRLDQAEDHFQKAWQFARNMGVEAHPLVALGLADFAQMYEHEGKLGKALNTIRTATTMYLDRMIKVGGALSRGIGSERKLLRRVFIRNLNLALKQSDDQQTVRDSLLEEAFRASQLASYVSVGEAISAMSARISVRDEKLAALIRKRQDARERWQLLDRQLAGDVVSISNKQAIANTVNLRQEPALLRKKIQDLDDRIAKNFPKYSNLTGIKLSSLMDVQKALKSDEVIIKWVIGDDRSFLWFISRDLANAFHLNISKAELNRSVRILRRHLVPSNTLNVRRLGFPVEVANELYQKLLGPVDRELVGFKHLIVIPDAGLQSLPIGVLVAKPPVPVHRLEQVANHIKKPQTLPNSPETRLLKRGTAKSIFSNSGKSKPFSAIGAKMRDVAWLARRYAISVMPSVRSFVELRSIVNSSNATRPFIGFGDPVLSRDNRSGEVRSAINYFNRRGGVDLEALKELPELLETADELNELASYLGAGLENVHTRHDATEGNLKKLDLTMYRVIAFATHGLVAGESFGLGEPALVMSPPSKTSAVDDGLLTSSEIAQLELDADLVILSACNTAAPGGSPGADGLSGLAKSFFYAGARSLLVSHWPVVSDTAKRLTTNMFEQIRRSPDIGWAEALRQSMINMIDQSDEAYYAHPLFWAPFVIVGEGGVQVRE